MKECEMNSPDPWDSLPSLPVTCAPFSQISAASDCSPAGFSPPE